VPTQQSVVVLLSALGVGIVLLVWFLVSIERVPVDRNRVETFAARHDLVVTAANGDQVIRYLATTRRWRITGLTAGVLSSTGWAVTHGAFIRVDLLTMLAGWFAGALIAEVRVARHAFGPRRAASLVPRHASAYLSRRSWLSLPIATAISGSIGIATVVALVRGQPVGRWSVPFFAAAMALAVAVRLVQRRVLRRAQPIAEPDVLAADDAIRSRSLHVLAGGGASLVLYCALGQLHGLADDGIQRFTALGMLGVPLLGWIVATARWPVRRDAATAEALP
jgi:hypothetical protein